MSKKGESNSMLPQRNNQWCTSLHFCFRVLERCISNSFLSYLVCSYQNFTCVEHYASVLICRAQVKHSICTLVWKTSQREGGSCINSQMLCYRPFKICSFVLIWSKLMIRSMLLLYINFLYIDIYRYIYTYFSGQEKSKLCWWVNECWKNQW